MAKLLYKNGITSVILRVVIADTSSTTGGRLTGLTEASAGLIISTIADNEATATAYTQASSNIETITTLGTFSAPTSGKCRFKEVDATNHPGLYEIQIADARWSVSNAKSVIISVLGATNALQVDAEIQLSAIDVNDGIRAALTALPSAAADAAGGLPISDTGNLDMDAIGSGVVTVNNRLGAWTGTGNETILGAFQSTLRTDGPTLSDIGGSYDPGEESQEALRTRGDIAWVTATGFSTHTAAQAADAVWDEAVAAHPTAGTFGGEISLFDASSDTVDLGSIKGTALPAETAAGSLANNFHQFYDVNPVSGQTIDDVGGGGGGGTDWTSTEREQIRDRLGIDGTKATPASSPDPSLIVGFGLDHLVFRSVTGTDITDNCIVARLVDNAATADWDNYNNTLQSLKAILTTGNASWVTATGFSTHTAADVADAVWDEARSGHTTAGTFGEAIDDGVTAWVTATGFSTHTAAQAADAVWDELVVGHAVSGSFGELISTINSNIVTVNTNVLTVNTNVVVVQDRLGSWTGSADNTILGAFQALARTDGPAVSDIGGTFTPSSDSQQAIRSRGDVAWITSTLTTSAIADAVWDETTSGHTTAGTFGASVTNIVSATVSAIPELGVGTPSATPTLANAVMFLYMGASNKRTSQDGTDGGKIFNSSGVVICEADIADNGTVGTRERFLTA